MSVLASLLAGLGLCLIPSPGDGHCLLHSFVTSYNTQLSPASQLCLNVVKDELINETLTNAHEYVRFSAGDDTALIGDLLCYTEEKRYNQDFCDLVPKILSTAYSVAITVVDETADGVRQITFNSDTGSHVYIHRRGDHYNGLSKITPHSFRPIKSYTSDELHYLNCGNISITRKTRKSLFHYHLWRPHCDIHTTDKPSRDVSSKRLKYSTFALMNARSVRNKTDDIKDYIHENDVDVLAITESHLRPDDDVSIGEITPDGYSLSHVPRLSRSGGGVALIHRTAIKMQVLNVSRKPHSFEVLETTLTSKGSSLRMIVVYRPPRSAINTHTVSNFIDEFSDMLTEHITSKCPLLIVGDFNIHLDNTSDVDACNFLSHMSSCGLTQHVRDSTHEKGHILDLVITRDTDKLVHDLSIDAKLSDHFIVRFQVDFDKQISDPKAVSYRKLRSVNMSDFELDLKAHDFSNETNIEHVVNEYNVVLGAILDKHAPKKTKTINVDRNAPWYNEVIRTAKRERRKLERRWRKNKSNENRDAYAEQRKQVSNMVRIQKTEYFSNLVLENSTNPRGLFKILDSLLHRKKQTVFPPDIPHESLATAFSSFFVDKVSKIREGLGGQDVKYECAFSNSTSIPLTSFSFLDSNDIRKIILNSKSTTCELDPIPTTFLKACIDTLLPVITRIVNLSMQTGCVPLSLKQAVVHPLLKKIILELILSNYRPVSNLPFISKVLERCVAKQLITHQTLNDFADCFQSAYKEGHSTETALVRVHNDLLSSIDKKNVVLLLLLDMSAAFDTVDHEILLTRLERCFSINGTAIEWFRSYLTDRSQYVAVDELRSEVNAIGCGVPQGSVLGPILFSMYISPLGDIAQKHGIQYHLYADDSQLYISFQPSLENAKTMIERVENCVSDINIWMEQNFLKLNKSKTELLLIGTKQQLHKLPDIKLQISSCIIEPSSSVRDLGATFDSCLSMNHHVSNIVRTCFYHLRNVASIKACLNKPALLSAVHAFVTSRLDSGNSLLSGISQKQLSRVQRVQNAAARLIKGVKKRDHITPVLRELHWLPIKQRIHFKILCLTYKALQYNKPKYLADLLKHYSPSVNLRSKSKLNLAVPKVNLKSAGERSFAFTAPTLWNALPYEIKTAVSFPSFKSQLKTHLFKQAF